MTHHWRLITDESSSGPAKSYCVILYFPLMLQKKCLTVAPVIPVYPVSGLILRFFGMFQKVSLSMPLIPLSFPALRDLLLSRLFPFPRRLPLSRPPVPHFRRPYLSPSIPNFPSAFCLLVPLRLRLSLLFPFLGFPPSFPHPLG